MNIDLTGRVALVTASTAGIGHAIARGLADSGAEVVLHGRSAATPCWWRRCTSWRTWTPPSSRRRCRPWPATSARPRPICRWGCRPIWWP